MQRDAIILLMEYRVTGRKATVPKTLDLVLSTYTFARRGLRYQDDHRLKIIVDGKQVISSDTSAEPSGYDSGVALEAFRLNGIRYKDFLKIIRGKVITVQLGKTELVLNEVAIQTLKDLNNTIER
jgi:hypothetical protein